MQPRTRYNEALSFITGGLQDVSLSRSKITWGVEVPWDEGHVFYVWFDALLNYYTALSLRARGRGPDGQVLAGVPHHRQGHPEVPHGVLAGDADGGRTSSSRREIFIHGFLLMKDSSGDEHKMSKSLGNVLDPFEVMDRFGTDALRYYCFREVSFGQDGGVSTAGLRRPLHERAGQRLRQPRVAARPTWSGATATARRRRSTLDPELAPDFEGLREEVAGLLDQAEITQALERIWVRVRRLNRYVEETQPWQLAKDETQARPSWRRRCARSPRACAS